MNFEEYRRHDGLGLAKLVADGEVTAAELLELAIARAEAVNPQLNALIIPMYELARERASAPLSGPFAGVPFLTKDLFQDYAGVRTAYGCKGLKAAAYTAPHHAEITRRWLNAGTVIFGRTNTPEFGAKGITEPEAWGACRNPWDTDRSPGGSSGGSAAAVAAGVVPMAGANDGGGSIRIPAGYCGLFGLKPGRGRTPWGPDFGELMHGAAMNHVLSRSVRDSAAMLDASHGPEVCSPFHATPPERPYLEEVGRDPGKLVIGFTTRSPIGGAVDAESVKAVENAATLLQSLGHEVVEAEPDINGERLARDFLWMWFANCAVTVDAVKRETGCSNAGFEADTLALAAYGRALRGNEYLEGYLRWGDYVRQLAQFHMRHDLLMMPTMALPPPRIGELDTPWWQKLAARLMDAVGLSRALMLTGLIDKLARESLRYVPFTQLGNLTGTPAMSVPLHWTESGLPLGVQFVAPVSGEGLLFRLAAQLEQAQPWFERVPAL